MQTDELGSTRRGCHTASPGEGKVTMVRLARISAWARHEPAQIGGFRQGHSTDPSTRERHHDDEYLREDGKCGRGKCNEDLGNNVCNYCATREAREVAADVKVVGNCSRQVSTLDAVRGNLADRGGLYCGGFRNSVCFYHFMLIT